MPRDDYLTILEPGTAQLRVLGSRFVGTALAISNEDDIAELLAAERKQYHDATHWCYAARWGVEPAITERANDAGEPKGTAGIPILREIQRRGLVNALVIVTRYFGGTKLGTGNLARAYADCAREALENAVMIRRTVSNQLIVECLYEMQSVVYHIAQKYQATVEPMPSESQAVMRLTFRASLAAEISHELGESGHGKIVIHSAST